MKRRKIKFNAILFAFLTLLVMMLWGFIIYSNILPFKYILIGITVFLILLVGIWFLLFFKRNKDKKKRSVIGYVLCAIIVILMSFIFIYLNNTLNFFKGFSDNKYKNENYLVIVLKDSGYETLDDLKDKTLGYVPSDLNKIDQALTELNNKVTVENKKYEQYDTMFADLISKKIDSLLIEESNLSILEESSDYASLIKSIYTVTISTEIVNTAKSVDVTNTPFSIYISGGDSYGALGSVSRSDVNMVVTVNPETKQVFMVSIPRDYYVQLHGTTGYKDKLTHSGLYGIDTSVSTIEDLLGIDINYYYRVNFSTLEKVVDAIGGVDVYSAYSFNSSEATGGTFHFSTGYNHMTGEQALSFSRERHALSGGDRARGENQQAVIDGIIRKSTSASIITKYTSLLNSLKNSFQTNMNEDDILKLIKMQIGDMAKWNITSFSLDGSDASEYTYSYQHQKLYVMKPKEETVTKATDLIKQVISGTILDSSYKDTASNVKNPTTVVIRPTTPTETIKSTITLVGDSSITITKGETYEDKGATAVDGNGKAIEVTKEGTVDTTKVGTYTITYSVSDGTKKTRTVIVKEAVVEESKIVLNGDANITLSIILNEKYVENGAKATDLTGTTLVVKTTITLDSAIVDTVDTSKEGTYTITYTATDTTGKELKTIRTVTVTE